MFRLLLLTLPLFAQDSFYLKDGDTVVFYGDSITDQRLYTTFTEAYVLTRFPKLNVRFVHSGWSGDQVGGGFGGAIDVRLARDVFAYHPTVVTIMLGMNDGRYRAFDPAIFQTYTAGYEHIVKSIQANLPSARITAIQPSPFDDVTRTPQFEGGYNGVLVRYGSFVQELAAREHFECADFNSSVAAMLLQANATNSALAQQLIPDRVHPAAPTHFIMAEALLKTWHAPALVSAVEIDAAARTVRTSSHTSASFLADDPAVAWTQLDAALPMPVEKFPNQELLQLAFSSSDFIRALDRQMVTVSGLAPGQYALQLDGQTVAEYSADQWRAGVNLAPLDTPMSKQASQVLQLIYRHNQLHWARWHLIQTSLEADKPPSMDEAMAALDKLENEVIALAHAKAQPQPHQYQLIAVAAAQPPYPAHWWTPVPENEKAVWEILPQAAQPGEVILSKRNELGILSNFAATPFTFRGRRYASVEGFWQMMLYPETPQDPRLKPGIVWPHTRDQVAQMTAFEAKAAGEIAEANMQKLGIDWVTFEGQRLPYRSKEKGEHYRLIVSAMRAKLDQNPKVREILLSTGNLVLKPDHIEEPDPPAEWLYFKIWMEIRSELH